MNKPSLLDLHFLPPPSHPHTLQSILMLQVCSKNQSPTLRVSVVGCSQVMKNCKLKFSKGQPLRTHIVQSFKGPVFRVCHIVLITG